MVVDLMYSSTIWPSSSYRKILIRSNTTCWPLGGSERTGDCVNSCTTSSSMVVCVGIQLPATTMPA